jgi:WD40 repeat protein
LRGIIFLKKSYLILKNIKAPSFTLLGPTSTVSDLIYLTNGYLISGPGLTQFWDINNGSLALTCPFLTSTIGVLSNGELVAGISGSINGSIIDPDTGLDLIDLVGAMGEINVFATLSDNLLASVGADKNIYIWDTNTGTIIKNLTGPAAEGVSLVGMNSVFLFYYFNLLLIV